MDVGDNLAAPPVAIADVLHLLLPWLRADANSALPLTAPVFYGVEDALEAATSFGNGDELVLALRALLARAEVGRKAARLATTSTGARASSADLTGAAGAARWAHAAALCRIVRMVEAPGDRVCMDEAVCSRLLALCSRGSEVALVEDSAQVWKQLADDVEAYKRRNPLMMSAQTAQAAREAMGKFGGFSAGGGLPLVMMSAGGDLLSGDDARADPELLAALSLPDDA
jgi:hypothetical protein